MNELREISLYIHIPFCNSKCYYCDFLSACNKAKYEKDYIICLCKEIIKVSKVLENYYIKTIFIGGGTPSCLSIDSLRILLSNINIYFNINKNTEFTIECNPGSVSDEKVKIFRENNINRVSVGLQTTNDNLLNTIGRKHTIVDYDDTIKLLKKYNYDNINTDVIYGLPGQTIKNVENTINYVLSKKVSHISAYNLILEKGTTLYTKVNKKELIMPSEDSQLDMSKCIKKILENNKVYQYEISNYAKNGKECNHNLVYWDVKEYIGLGLGSSSCFKNQRYRNENNIEKYINDAYKNIFNKYDIINLTKNNIMEEFMFLGLRKIKGINKEVFKKRFNINIYNVYGDVIKKLINEKLLIDSKENVLLTQKGLNISNYVLSYFLLD